LRADGVITEETVGEAAYRRIRADIVFGRVLPGQKLRLDRMKSDYGVGISTLREILSRLAAEGLVLAEGQRGFEVPPVTAQNLRELADLRRLIEGHALRQSFAAGDTEWEGRVVAAHHKLSVSERRRLSGDMSGTETWKRYDMEFHRALISACGSVELMQTHEVVFEKYLRYLMVSFTFRGEVAAEEHRVLRDAALERDADRAIEVLATHVGDCVDHALTSGRVR